MAARTPFATVCLVLLSQFAATQVWSADDFDRHAFLKSHCFQCHGPEKQEAKLRLDQLPLPTASEVAAEKWALIADMVEAGDMPPAKQPRPAAEDVKNLTTWISAELARIAKPVPALRRLNRTEYEYTLHDLLQIDSSLAEYLPEDAQVQGFDNVAGGLGISSILLERYLEAANVAFEDTIRRIEPLPAQKRRSVLMERDDNKDSVAKNKGGVIESHGAFVDFTAGWPPARVDECHPIEDGQYKVRVAVWPYEPNDHRTLSVAIFTGPLFGDGKRIFHGIFDVTGTPEKPRIIEFTAKMQEGNAVHVLPRIYPEHVTWRDKHEKRPGIAIAWVETEGPLDQSFPSESQKNLFGESDTMKLAEGWPVWMRHRKNVKSHFVDSTDPQADIQRILTNFAPRAFRRPVSPELVDQFVQLAYARLEAGNTFEQAVRAGVTAMLCSPHFLMLNQNVDLEAGEVDDYTIASRMSYFLWSSMPDEELFKLAAAGKLKDPKVRHAQVERMLKDPKRERLVKNFTDQWLDLREIEFTTPDAKLYPEYDDLLLQSMLKETRGFFRHVLENDLSVMNFVDSDFAILNQRMATHYGIEGVRGHEEFRVVKLPEDSIRGGVLTQASVLKVTANGTSTSPVIRGVWVIDKLLGQPAPPPPPGVPAVEPDIRGATTIREQLKKHRDNESCARCHARIDPPGFALEEFDVIGGHRDWYRSVEGEGKKIHNTQYYEGLSVESDAVLPSGKDFKNFTEFRELLKQDPEQIAKAMAEKLLVYGCGRPIGPQDQENVNKVVQAAAKDDYGFKSMIHAVVDSELFLRP